LLVFANANDASLNGTDVVLPNHVLVVLEPFEKEREMRVEGFNNKVN